MYAASVMCAALTCRDALLQMDLELHVCAGVLPEEVERLRKHCDCVNP